MNRNVLPYEGINATNHTIPLLVAIVILTSVQAQEVKRDIPYTKYADKLQILDVYSSRAALRSSGKIVPTPGKKTISLLTAAVFPIPITAQSGRAIFNLSAGGLIVSQPRRFLEEVGHDSS